MRYRGIFSAIHAGVVQAVGSGDRHVRVADKEVPYPATPEGVPAAEWLLPLLLAAVHEGRCTLPELARHLADGPARLAAGHLVLDGKGWYQDNPGRWQKPQNPCP